MIDWVLVASASAGAMLANEFVRRRALAKGRFFSFQPVMQQRVLAMLGCLAAVLCIEAGRVAIAEPSGEHVWGLIAAAAFAFVLLLIQTGRELNFACKEISRLRGLR